MQNSFYGFTIIEITDRKYQVTGNNCPSDMEIRINKEHNGYRAECNYSLKNKNASNSYQAMHCLPTLEETINHLLMSLQPNKDSSWIKN